MKQRKAALKRAKHLIARVSNKGFQWPDLKGPLEKVHEEINELEEEIKNTIIGKISSKQARALEAELGDVLFTICNVAYFLKVSPEDALQKMLNRFERRFSFVEKKVVASRKPWKSFSLAELDQFWAQAKKREKKRR